jgi:hypothetical protein
MKAGNIVKKLQKDKKQVGYACFLGKFKAGRIFERLSPTGC